MGTIYGIEIREPDDKHYRMVERMGEVAEAATIPGNFPVEAFPALRYMRDVSEESHRMRMKDPEQRIVRFWERVILRCSQKGVWCEDWEGVNVTMRGLKRASMRKQEDAKWNWF